MAYMYILKCSNGTYYTGSTRNLRKRINEHQAGLGANYTRKHLPVELMYFEEYQSVKQAFEREKQIQGWSHTKKEALIEGRISDLPKLAKKVFRKGEKENK